MYTFNSYTLPTVPVVQITNDYSTFKHLGGNRAVDPDRFGKIMASVKAHGYIPNPIIVNEKYEVVDGQGRLAVLESLGLPVYYISVPGLGIDDCIAMNINQKAWVMLDYINAFAEIKVESYVMAKQLIDYFQPSGIRYQTIIAALKNNIMYVNNDVIKSGKFACTKEDIERTKAACEWLVPMVPFVKEIIRKRSGGNQDSYMQALLFVYSHTDLDEDKVAESIMNNSYNYASCNRVVDALKEIETGYNRKYKRGKRADIVHDYDVYNRSLKAARMNEINRAARKS